jgi:thiamine-monophosphate kinase
MPSRSSRPTEDELIVRYFEPLAGDGGLALKDDAAVLTPSPDHDLVLTADALVAGVHFFPDDPPAAIAWKALGVNVSDIAAKGARPAGFLLALALPEDWTEPWLKAFCAGLREASATYDCPLLGGDTVRARGPLSLSITAIGEVPTGRMVRRTTARPGDWICMTGTIGDAALGLALRLDGNAPWAQGLSQDDRDFLLDRYLHPRPRLAMIDILRAYANAAMDVSDGLAGDLAKMLRASGATAAVETAKIPLSAAACRAMSADAGLLDRIVTGGDDYEILCTVPEDKLASFLAASERAGVPAAAVGRVLAGEGLPVFRDGATERRYERGSFSHF